MGYVKLDKGVAKPLFSVKLLYTIDLVKLGSECEHSIFSLCFHMKSRKLGAVVTHWK
jgi:hypothetical protein